MNEKRKFSKLRLPAAKRNTSHSQISKFFAQSHSDIIKLDGEDSNSSNSAPRASDYQSLSLPNPGPSIDTPEDDTKPSLQLFECTSTNEIKNRKASGRSPSRNTIKEFCNQSASENDFEIPKKIAKKGPKKSVTTSQQRRKGSAAGSSKRQPKIKNILLQKEELLSEFIAEQSFAEHIDPNEMQMALALSRSEVETCRIEGYENSESGDGISSSTECFRLSLEKFRYKLNKNNKDNLTNYTTGKSRAKWANKFTSLTMRDSNRQQEKVNKKIETFLELQYTHAEDTEKLVDGKLMLASSFLLSMKPLQPTYLRHSFDLGPSDIAQFFVADIFQPTTIKVGHLLKDFRTIPGRDLSPIKSKEQVQSDVTEKLNKGLAGVLFLKTIDLVGEPCSSRHETNEKVVRECSPDLFDDSEMEELEEIEPLSATKSSTMESLVLNSSNSEQRTIQELKSCAITSSGSIPTITYLNRDKSFVCNENMAVETISISSSSNSNDVVTYDKFSSDEVKTFDRSSISNKDSSFKHTSKSLHPDDSDDNIVDLTQEDEEQHESSQYHNEQISQLSTSDPMSINLNEDENPSQESSSSIIILSDDEVNYSMKVIKGLAISVNSLSQSDNKSISVDKNSSNASDSEKGGNFFNSDNVSKGDKHSNCDLSAAGPSCMHDNRNLSPYSDHSTDKNNFMEAIQTTEIMKHNLSYNSSNYEKHNYSLAHEVMSCSFLEESEKCNMNEGSDKNITLPRTTTEEILFLDLTQSSPTSVDSNAACPDLEDTNTSRKYNNSVKYSKSHSDSFLLPKTTTPKSLRRFSSNKKFTEFIDDNLDFSDTDEFDRLVYGSPSKRKKQLFQCPEGLSQLLTGNINSVNANESYEEFIADSKTYLVKISNVKGKPDYARMDSPTRLKELYKYGLKPLKRKQALIMLEYIYNQTHPYVVEDSDEENELVVNEVPNANDVDELLGSEVTGSHNMFNLKDCFGACLLEESELRAELEQENYIFQTNIRTTIRTALLPLHVAWFNLIKSNEKLFEAVLCYEPIDLQEIYIFLKRIGCRYDPKDIKRFFDGRGIVFQYDLNKEGSNRHIRKARKPISQKSSKVS